MGGQVLHARMIKCIGMGDVLDVANFCAFLFARGERVSAAQAQPDDQQARGTDAS